MRRDIEGASMGDRLARLAMDERSESRGRDARDMGIGAIVRAAMRDSRSSMRST